MARVTEILYPLAWVLYKQNEWPSRAAIARSFGQNPATIQMWLDHLEHHRVLRKQKHGVRVDRNRLPTILTAHRIAGQRPGPRLQTRLGVEEMEDRLNGASIDHAFCLFTAANRWTFYEPRQDFYLYINRQDRTEVRRLLHDGDGDRQVFPFLELVSRIPQITRDGVTATSPFFTVLDLKAHPEGGAHASFLEQHLLPRLTDV